MEDIRKHIELELDILRRMSTRRDSTDVLGSYTGTAADGEQPVQDADDL